MNIDEMAKQLFCGLSLDQLRERQNAAVQAAAKPKTQEQIAAECEYWNRVFAERTAKQEFFVTRQTNIEMEYEDARRRFWAIMQMRAAHIAQLENNQEFQWEVDEPLAVIIRSLVKYFINDKSGAYPLTKGLFIFGQNGTGKTEILTALARFCEQYDLGKKFVFCSMSEVYNRARADKDYDPIEENQQFDRCFDEFGRNVGPVIRFGDPLDINEAI